MTRNLLLTILRRFEAQNPNCAANYLMLKVKARDISAKKLRLERRLFNQSENWTEDDRLSVLNAYRKLNCEQSTNLVEQAELFSSLSLHDRMVCDRVWKDKTLW